mmetsp:Transcript_8079/g.22861  ORF Transcript_8079/g.22861 Transcript_8079/m.22861 type:complete len:140 (+) Transcript_8079:1-420(+)
MFSDSRVSKVTEEAVLSLQAYVLFYWRVPSDDLKNLREEVKLKMHDGEMSHYISRRWWERFQHSSWDSPISNTDFLCPHGGVKVFRTPSEDVPQMPAKAISASAWRCLYERFGGGPEVTELIQCRKCNPPRERQRKTYV